MATPPPPLPNTMTDLPTFPGDDFERLTGLFRVWELPQVIDDGAEFFIEPSGSTSDDEPLFAVSRRQLPPPPTRGH